MHFVIGQDNLHSIIFKHLKEFFHDFFEGTAERFDAALFIVITEKSFAKSKKHCGEVGHIIYVGGFALNNASTDFACHIQVFDNLGADIFYSKVDASLVYGSLTVSICFTRNIFEIIAHLAVPEQHIFGK